MLGSGGFDADRATAIMKQIEELQSELKYTLSSSGQFHFSARTDEDEGTRSGADFNEKGKEEEEEDDLKIALAEAKTLSDDDKELERVFGGMIDEEEKRESSKRQKGGGGGDMTKLISPAALSRLNETHAERAEARRLELEAEKTRRTAAIQKAQKEREIAAMSIKTYMAHAKPHEYTIPPRMQPGHEKKKKKKPFVPWGKYKNNNNNNNFGRNPPPQQQRRTSSKRARDPYQGGDWLGGGTRSDRAGGADRK